MIEDKATTTRYEISILKKEVAKIKNNLAKNNIVTVLTFGFTLLLTLFVSILFFSFMNKSIQVHLENNTSVEQKGSLNNTNKPTTINSNNSGANANLEQKKGFINK